MRRRHVVALPARLPQATAGMWQAPQIITTVLRNADMPAKV
jgi:hypothetical protein